MSELIRKQVAQPPVAAGDGTVWFIASTETRDRDGDIIRQDGWVLAPFRANPVILYQHDMARPPIGRAVEVAVVNQRLMVRVEFAPASVSEAAAEIGRLVTAGFLNAVSVGFRVLDSAPLAGGGYEFRKNELYEISVVSVPAQADALVVSRSAVASGGAVESWARRSGRDDGRIVLELDDEPSVKAGRVLSNANREHLLSADDAICEAQRRVRNVLEAAGDDDVIDIDDEPHGKSVIDLIDEIDFDERDLAAALRDLLPQLIADVRAERALEIRRALSEEMMRVTGVLPGGDPAARRAWSASRTARR